MGAIKLKGLNRLAKIGQYLLFPREKYIRFDKLWRAG
jgi:hypothetical protein